MFSLFFSRAYCYYFVSRLQLQVQCIRRDFWRLYVMVVNEWKRCVSKGFIQWLSVARIDEDWTELFCRRCNTNTVEDSRPIASMPSMRQSYTVTVPEEPPAAAFPFLKQEMRRRGSMSGSVLVSTFVGLLINQAKVRGRKKPTDSTLEMIRPASCCRAIYRAFPCWNS